MTAEEVGTCPECGSTDKGTRYQIVPPTESNPLGTYCMNDWPYCMNDWHHVPEVYRDDEFTPLEFQVIFGWCLRNERILRQLGITEDLADGALMSIYKKLGTSGSGLIEFAKAALNAELRRRSGRGE